MKIVFHLLFCLFSLTAFSQTQIKLEDLSSHVGDSVSLSGKVYGISYLQQAKNTPTFINVGAKYPNQLLTIVIWGNVRSNFNYDLSKPVLSQGMVKVSGKVELYKGKPQIVIHNPSQILFIYDEEVPADTIPPVQKKNGN